MKIDLKERLFRLLSGLRFVIHLSYLILHPKSYYMFYIDLGKRYLAHLVWVEVDSEFAAKLTLFV